MPVTVKNAITVTVDHVPEGSENEAFPIEIRAIETGFSKNSCGLVFYHILAKHRK